MTIQIKSNSVSSKSVHISNPLIQRIVFTLVWQCYRKCCFTPFCLMDLVSIYQSHKDVLVKLGYRENRVYWAYSLLGKGRRWWSLRFSHRQQEPKIYTEMFPHYITFKNYNRILKYFLGVFPDLLNVSMVHTSYITW